MPGFYLILIAPGLKLNVSPGKNGLIKKKINTILHFSSFLQPVFWIFVSSITQSLQTSPSSQWMMLTFDEPIDLLPEDSSDVLCITDAEIQIVFSTWCQLTTALRAQRTQPTISLVPFLRHFQDITLNRVWEQTHLICSWMSLSDLQGIDKRSFVNMEKKLCCMLKVFYKDSPFQISVAETAWTSCLL